MHADSAGSALGDQEPVGPRGAWGRVQSAAEGGDPAPPLSEATSGAPCPALGSSVQEGRGAAGEGPAQGQKDGSGTEALADEERLRVLGWCSQRREHVEEISLKHAKISKAGAKKLVPDSLVVPSNRMGSNGHKPNTRSFIST